MAESTYTVQGMTCGHCASSVTEEVGRIEGVRKVDVDLAGGQVTVVSDEPVAEDAVRAAVTEAGYELVAS
jgi:copper ion binding protein